MANRSHDMHFITTLIPFADPEFADSLPPGGVPATRCSNIRLAARLWPRMAEVAEFLRSMCCMCITPSRTPSQPYWRNRCSAAARIAAVITTLHSTDITLVECDRSYFQSPNSPSKPTASLRSAIRGSKRWMSLAY